MRRAFLAGALSLVSSLWFVPASAQTLSKAIVKVRLKTSKGTIVLALEARRAPITTANFLLYVDAGKLDGANFWRAMRSGPEAGFIQGAALGFKFPPIKHEPTSKTGLSHTDGTISMARFAVGTASNQFTISVGDMSYMDAKPAGTASVGDAQGEDSQGYAAFGKVISGMAVVKAILNGRIARQKKKGGWDGQMLEKPVIIISAKRLK
jgi:peptidyl-prolyl cis-trans isomerase A (cyclophilin A)